ncbi:Glycerol-3-phosphate dehydrogenase [Plasmodiophora brassicae]|uniref:Glycerol-3-phosphate dehydrogenase n=1 Tax=Plasmodiophora brassicae TaxID=37360 RepID=A0A3P3Y6G9_PLABS|nr:unnamed protein product [Plasmodiophora brassicae]
MWRARRALAGAAVGAAVVVVGSPSAMVSSEAAPDHRRRSPSRGEMVQRTRAKQYDVLVIGGGATGAGIALDAVTRGLSVCLVERDDFASGTSSRSSKLIHGGVRYLEKAVTQLDYSQLHLVHEALRERRHLMTIAPHLVRALPTIVPNYDRFPLVLFTAPYYYIGMKVYDLVAGKSGALKSSYFMTREQALTAFPMLNRDGLKCAVVYYDGLHDDARMNLAIALTAIDRGADVLNHTCVTALLKDASGKVTGATVRDAESGDVWDISAKTIVNATGPFSDAIRKLDSPSVAPMICPSVGVHVTLPDSCSPADMGLLIPKTSDGRVLFLLPWEGSTIAGTTDAASGVVDLPTAHEKEVDWILDEVSQILCAPVGRDDVASAWAGIRPLAKPTSGVVGGTQGVSRDHVIDVDPVSGLITIAGGKWTTYRAMAQDVVDRIAPGVPCITYGMPLIGTQGWTHETAAAVSQQGSLPDDVGAHLAHSYGARALEIAAMCKMDPDLAKRLAPGYAFIRAEVLYSVRNEHALTVVDVMARRTRLAFLNTSAAREALPAVIALMGDELRWDQQRRIRQYQAGMTFLSTMGAPAATQGTDAGQHLGDDFFRVDTSRSGSVSVDELEAVVFGSPAFRELSRDTCSQFVRTLQECADDDTGRVSLQTFLYAASQLLDT